ncbi:tRNA (adenosine(37)-N6)-threonylcarbamoyltransferase complex dimerization subunit type 1 TsaB [Pleionea sediminis]|uniref:tRNA (adenosine(37)-N6)-threonylcarbamoyltransferase complex dimerization subunit type 1 TsaB n=1 Tax=Pleionea sediminis TaxID=2569479 RepID=UPI0011854BF0|nr:tRNA (adenosine(37)-N6)-threonylcarbamoyltransferase complex dimerization subunit type 1 TsaB [Pleionea sediminis]
MIRLAIDTSTEAFSVAVEKDGVVEQEFDLAPRKHGELMLPAIKRLLAKRGVSINQVEQIVYGRGPGAFTGIRIAISAAQGLALGVGCSLIGISSLQNLALQAFENTSANYAVVAMDARMGEVYFAVYKRTLNEANQLVPQLVGEEQVIKPEEVEVVNIDESIVAIGSAWDVYADVLSQALGYNFSSPLINYYPDAKANLTLAQLPEHHASAHRPEQAVPSYLRNNVAEKSTKPSLIKPK